jgi:hypothetical protein
VDALGANTGVGGLAALLEGSVGRRRKQVRMGSPKTQDDSMQGFDPLPLCPSRTSAHE